MKHAKKPTRKQKEYIKNARLNVENWLVIGEKDNDLILQHRYTGRTRSIKIFNKDIRIYGRKVKV